ncbi:MAG: putative DNA binding domain-containing protein, partial [Nanoarchaeota archaeon]|nr:putative DNA binding domain-containing protein [Nanoarchaeota archaeon]
ETISAFANKEGGQILVGIEENKDGSVNEIKGIKIKGKVIENLTNEIKQNTDPVIFPSVEIKRIKGKDVLVIEIEKSSFKPVFAKRDAFIRVGRTNRRLSSQEIRRMAKESGGYNFTELVCKEAGLKDLDKEKVKWFVKEAGKQRNLDIDEDLSVKEVLIRLKLLKDDKLTNAAVLLFGKNPQEFFLQTEIKCIRFKGTGVTGEMIDFKVIEGDIISQLKKAEDFIFEHIPKKAWIEAGELQRQEKWLYPPTAIREALANALVHRDYESPSKNQIRIFDNRIEFWNPGKLPEGWTIEKLKQKHDSIPKNPLMAKQFFWIRYIEEVGTGTNKIVEWCVDWSLPEPEFEFTGTSIVVTFRKPFAREELAKLGLNERQLNAIEYVEKKGSITNKEYQELNNSIKRTATRDLAGLAQKGIFRVVGKGKRELKYILIVGQNVPKMSQKMSQKKRGKNV